MSYTWAAPAAPPSAAAPNAGSSPEAGDLTTAAAGIDETDETEMRPCRESVARPELLDQSPVPARPG